jgi:hypothetical protein
MKAELAVKISLNAILSDKTFHWEKEGKEFFYKGNIYDLVSLQKIDNEYFVLAVNDVQEKAYLQNLAKNDPTSDDGLFSFAPFHLVPPKPIQHINLSTFNLPLDFYYSFNCKSHFQLTGYSPPDFLI